MHALECPPFYFDISKDVRHGTLEVVIDQSQDSEMLIFHGYIAQQTEKCPEEGLRSGLRIRGDLTNGVHEGTCLVCGT